MMGMSLSSLQLDAFFEVARAKSFSAAAKRLHLTQSALSQRVLNLEDELGSSLFVRESSGLRLTELGERLLRYCQSRNALEEEFLENLRPEGRGSLSGILKVAAFSTVTQSVLLPILAELTRPHPRVQLDVLSAEVRDLPTLLASGRADFVFTTQAIDRQGIDCELVALEENVLARPSGRKAPGDVYLDHDADDTTTHDFLKLQGKKIPRYRRSFLDDIHGIIEGVRLGLGQAVLPLHLVRGQKGIEIVETPKSLKVPVYFCAPTQAFRTELHRAFIEHARARFPEILSSPEELKRGV